MPGYPWAHFACHAEASLPGTVASHLLLQDYASKPLTVLDIAGLRLEQAEVVALLSACSTATTGGALPDEAINLASAHSIASYGRVIATLWPVDNTLAADLAAASTRPSGRRPGPRTRRRRRCMMRCA